MRTKTLGGENFHPMQDINFEFASSKLKKRSIRITTGVISVIYSSVLLL